MAKTNNTLPSKGKVDIDRDILLSIINLATKEISGVHALTNNYMPWIKRIFVKPKSEGVRIKIDNNNCVSVDIYIIVNNGYSVPDIAFRVQENVKNSLNAMVGLKAGKINVHVLGVVCDKDEGVVA